MKNFETSQQVQATSNRPGITRSEVYEVVNFNETTGEVSVINDDGKISKYSNNCFRTMKDDFAGMFGLGSS